MPKRETAKIQNYLVKLGKHLGFKAEKEYSFNIAKDRDLYYPIYDVVWFLNLKKFKLKNLAKYIQPTFGCENLKKIVLATFEIEGSTTTSKNQVGNYANLFLSPSLYNFVIVNNSGAVNEHDTYRRGVKIHRTISHFMGENNTIFCDWSQIKKVSFPKIKEKDKKITLEPSKNIERSAVGGEKKESIKIFDKIISELCETGMEIRQNYTPERISWQYEEVKLYRSIETDEKFDFLLNKKFVYSPSPKEIKPLTGKMQYFYLPKIDISLGFNLPHSFYIFLGLLAGALGTESVNFPVLLYIQNNQKDSQKKLFFPYLGIEIESEVNKHLNGGMLNCSLFFYFGLLISPSRGKSSMNTYKKHLGLNNLFHYDRKGVLAAKK